MKNVFPIIALLCICVVHAGGQTISVSPAEARVYSQGATSALLTYSNLGPRLPAEATFCGALISTAPGLGMKCDPSAIFGRLPQRYNQSRLSRNNTFTDIMSVTTAVARLAYLDALCGSTGIFFYVRRFAGPAGIGDQYVPVTLRLGGNGASVPFSITNVRLLWDGGKATVPFVKSGERLPRITAEIFYTGSGRLVGRWELVKPGEALPSERDLLSEAALPVEERGTQRRFSELKRFNVFLLSNGSTTIPGPENWRIENTVNGMYLLLFRLEAAPDGLNGAVAGFAMPVLRYYVGTGGVAQNDQFNAADNSLAPADQASFIASESILSTWPQVPQAKYYRLVFENLTDAVVFSAVLTRDSRSYRAPSWLLGQPGNNILHWRVLAFDAGGALLNETPRRTLRRAIE
jgi:hypothetical protein